MKALPFIALVLIVMWLIFRVALAVTSGLLHLLWIFAVVMFILWLIGKMRGGRGGAH